MLLDEPQELRVHGRPDRCGRCALRAGTKQRIDLSTSARLSHVLDGNDDPEVELLPRARVDDPDRPRTRHKPADLLDRTLRRREGDALDRLAGQTVEALDRQREVRPALGARNGMHLVEDQRPDRLQHLAALRGQKQVERLRRRDQDVGRLAKHRRALFLGRVPGAHRDRQLGLKPGERPAQVPLDVVVQRLQRRDVEEAQPLAGRGVQLVDPVEESGERLARSGRRLDQRVLTRGDRRPASFLGGRRRRERPLEPLPRYR